VTFSVELEVQRYGGIIWRNNSGAAKMPNGRMVRYGLGNTSATLCDVLKSSDYIGITSDGRFLALELKPEGWIYQGTPHEQAQLAFMRLVARHGGVGSFVTCADDIKNVMKTRKNPA
jgi:hypothetical protein